MPNENERDALLQKVVEQICLTDAPTDRVQRCLDRIAVAAVNQQSDANGQSDRPLLAAKPTHNAVGGRRRWIAGIASLLVLATFLVFREGATSASLVDVARAISQKPWIHATERTSAGERETWFSPVNDVSATRDPEWLSWHDHGLKFYYSFDVAEGVLYRVPEIGRRRLQSHLADMATLMPLLLADGVPPEDPLSRMEFLKHRERKLRLVSQKVETRDVDGREWLDYTLIVQSNEFEKPIKMLFRVDPDSKLPHLFRVTLQLEGELQSYEATLDYPNEGPADIYAMGVPRAATLVDRVPVGDLARVIAGVEVGRARFDDFRAIVVSYSGGAERWWRESPQIIHRRGNRMRRDLSFEQKTPAAPPDEATSRRDWWMSRAEEFRYYPTRICIDGVSHSVKHRWTSGPDGRQSNQIVSINASDSGLNAEQWLPAFWSMTPDYVARPPLGVPNQDMEAVVETSAAGGPEGCLLLKVRRTGRANSAPDPDADRRPPQPDAYRFWVNPDREYLVMRMEMMQDDGVVDTSYTVEELAQSPKGHWYPTRVRRSSSRGDATDEIMEFHVDFDADIPESLFDVKTPVPIETGR